MSILLDAGPALNFLAVGQQNVLVQLGLANDLQLTAPERVDVEVEGKARDPRFQRTPVLKTWRILKNSKRLDIIPSDVTNELFGQAVQRVSGMAAPDRMKQRESLGEILVIAHASVYAQQGEEVHVLIDEQDGRLRAKREAAHLKRTRAPGSLNLLHTLQVLHEADRNTGWFKSGLTGEQVFQKMKKYDDGLQSLTYQGNLP